MYGELAQTATELLKEFGTLMVLRSNHTQGIYNPIEGEVTPGASVVTDKTIHGVMITPTAEYASSIPDGSVQANDMLVLVEPSSVEPSLSDRLVVQGHSWEIVNVQRIRPADVTVLYILQVRS